MYKSFCIKYKVLLEYGNSLENKEIKIKNCMGGVHAQIKLEEYLKKKYKNFAKLIVKECKEDLIFQYNDMFKNIFEGK